MVVFVADLGREIAHRVTIDFVTKTGGLGVEIFLSYSKTGGCGCTLYTMFWLSSFLFAVLFGVVACVVMVVGTGVDIGIVI